MNLSLGNASSSNSRPVTVAGQIVGTVFFVIFLGFGVVFLGLIGREMLRFAASHRWPAVPCVIESCVVDRQPDGSNRLAVRYRYEFNGQTRHSDRLALQAQSQSDYTAAQRLANVFPPGATVPCYVNPANPAQAVLRHSSLWFGFFAVIPLIFVAVGVFGIYAIWRRAPATATSPVAQRTPLFVFAVFLIVGAIASYFLSVRVFLKVQDARGWTATPCVVESSGVRSHRGSKGGTTYSVDILYRYAVAGRDYRANRYDFMGGSSSGYDAKAAVVHRFPPGTQAVCYVNPRDPADAVFERNFTPVMLVGLFPLAFFFVGAGGLAWTFTVGRAARVAISPNAEAPWLQRADWAARRIVYSAKSKATFAWVFAAIWNAIAVPVLVVLGPEAAKPGHHLLAIALILPAVGFSLIFAAMRATWRWQTFGDSVLELATLPGAVGGAFEGTIRLGRPVRPMDGFKLRLTCLNRVTTGSGKNRSTQERPLWQDEQSTTAGIGDAVPVAFYIPADCAETSATSPDNRIDWQLEATATVDGKKYKARFEVPVFKVAQTPEQAAEAQKVRAKEQADIARYQPPAESRIRVQTSARGGKEFYFPPARNPGVAAGLTAFLAPCAAGLWFTIHFDAPIIFPIVIGLVVLVVAYAALQTWFGTMRVVVERDGLTVTSGFLGAGRARIIATADVAEIKTKIGMTAGTTAYTDIKILCRNGKEITAGSAIKDVREAEWLAAQMTDAIGQRR